MIQEFITTSSAQTKKLGMQLAERLCGSEIICLSGDLGAGKTTFTQGLLKGLKIKGPYTSPTFSIVKEYRLTTNNKQLITKIESGFNKNSKLSVISNMLSVIYHIDAYRINSKDLIELGWNDFAGKPETVTIIEWPEKVKKLIPTSAMWINFEWVDAKKRKIIFQNFKIEK